MMDEADRKILEHELAVPVGKAVGQWVRKNNVEAPVIVHASVQRPSCYVDEQGVSHTGVLVVCNVHIVDEDDYDDDED